MMNRSDFISLLDVLDIADNSRVLKKFVDLLEKRGFPLYELIDDQIYKYIWWQPRLRKYFIKRFIEGRDKSSISTGCYKTKEQQAKDISYFLQYEVKKIIDHHGDSISYHERRLTIEEYRNNIFLFNKDLAGIQADLRVTLIADLDVNENSIVCLSLSTPSPINFHEYESPQSDHNLVQPDSKIEEEGILLSDIPLRWNAISPYRDKEYWNDKLASLLLKGIPVFCHHSGLKYLTPKRGYTYDDACNEIKHCTSEVLRLNDLINAECELQLRQHRVLAKKPQQETSTHKQSPPKKRKRVLSKTNKKNLFLAIWNENNHRARVSGNILFDLLSIKSPLDGFDYGEKEATINQLQSSGYKRDTIAKLLTNIGMLSTQGMNEKELEDYRGNVIQETKSNYSVDMVKIVRLIKG